MYWYMAVIPKLQRWSQKDQEFKVWLIYIASSRSVWATRDPALRYMGAWTKASKQEANKQKGLWLELTGTGLA